MKVLVLGASGLLGQALQLALESDALLAWSRRDCDITHPAAMSRIREAQPDVIVNAAAWTDVDGAENPDVWHTVRHVNAQSLGQLSEVSNDIGAHLVHISTNEVFPGTPKMIYDEMDPAGPINAYGRSKAEGEAILVQTAKRYCLVRVSWLFGHHGDDFPRKIARAADKFGNLRVVADEWGSPTYAADAAERIWALVRMGAEGTFHVTNRGTASRFEWARFILDHSGRSGVETAPITSQEWPRSASTPIHAVLGDTRMSPLGLKPLPDWRDASLRYLDAFSAFPQ